MKNLARVQVTCKERVEEALRHEQQCRQAKWAESLAVGSQQYVETIKTELGVRARGRKVTEEGGSHQLRDTESTYRCHDEGENGLLRPSNTFLWDLIWILQCLSLVRP